MAEIMTVEQFNTTRLRNSEFQLFATDVYTIIDSNILIDTRMVTQFSMNNNIKAVLNVYKAELERLDNAIQKLAKSQLTDPIADADRLRDDVSRGLELYVEAYSLSADEDMHEAARRILVLIGNYPKFRKKSYNEESADIKNYLQDLNEKHSDDIETINAGYWVDALEEANNSFMELMDSRFNEGVEEASAEVREVRTTLGCLVLKKVYRLLIKSYV